MQTVQIAGATLRGKSIDGTYPLVYLNDTHVIVKHPLHDNVKIARQFMRMPSSQGLPHSAPVTLTYDELKHEIRSRFQILDSLMDGVVEGRIRSMIVSGARGVGKTYTIETRLAKARAEASIRKYVKVSGTTSPLGLYVMMWENRHPGNIIVLDDSDEIFGDETGVNLIKAATDTSDIRRVSYVKELAMFEAQGIPKHFDYQGSLIVATNIDFDREIESNSKRAPHLQAVIDRALYMDLALHSRQALLARVEDVCTTTPMLTNLGLSQDQIGQLLGWVKDNQTSVRSISLRCALHLANMILTDPQHWRSFAKVTLLSAKKRR